MSERTPPSLDEVLSRISVSGTDPGVVNDYAVGLVAARSTRRRIITGCTVVVALLAATSLAVWSSGGTDPDEVVTPADAGSTTEVSGGAADSPSTTSPPTTTTTTTHPFGTATTPPAVAPEQFEVPGSAAALPTGPGSSTPAPTADTPVAAPPSTAKDRSPTATLEVPPGAAGDLLEVRFAFSDPDGPANTPVISMRTDEASTDNSAAAADWSSPSCSGGPGTSARLHEGVQFAGTGSHTVSVTVRYCEGPPLIFSTRVDIGAPRFGDGPGRAVMAVVPDVGELLEGARWSFRPAHGPAVDVQPGARGHTHRLAAVGGFSVRGVVIVLPAGVTGELLLQPAGSGTATYSGGVGPPPAPGEPATRVYLERLSPG